MRLDKFLKVSRLIKRRSVACDVCEANRVYVNGVLAKPSKQLHAGDIIKIEYRAKTAVFKVLIVPEGNVPAQSASGLYEELDS